MTTTTTTPTLAALTIQTNDLSEDLSKALGAVRYNLNNVHEEMEDNPAYVEEALADSKQLKFTGFIEQIANMQFPNFIAELAGNVLPFQHKQNTLAVLYNTDEIDIDLDSTIMQALGFVDQYLVQNLQDGTTVTVLSKIGASARNKVAAVAALIARASGELQIDGPVSDVLSEGFPALVLTPQDFDGIGRSQHLILHKFSVTSDHQQAILCGNTRVTFDFCSFADHGDSFVPAVQSALSQERLDGVRFKQKLPLGEAALVQLIRFLCGTTCGAAAGPLFTLTDGTWSEALSMPQVKEALVEELVSVLASGDVLPGFYLDYYGDFSDNERSAWMNAILDALERCITRRPAAEATIVSNLESGTSPVSLTSKKSSSLPKAILLHARTRKLIGGTIRPMATADKKEQTNPNDGLTVGGVESFDFHSGVSSTEARAPAQSNNELAGSGAGSLVIRSDVAGDGAGSFLDPRDATSATRMSQVRAETVHSPESGPPSPMESNWAGSDAGSSRQTVPSQIDLTAPAPPQFHFGGEVGNVTMVCMGSNSTYHHNAPSPAPSAAKSDDQHREIMGALGELKTNTVDTIGEVKSTAKSTTDSLADLRESTEKQTIELKTEIASAQKGPAKARTPNGEAKDAAQKLNLDEASDHTKASSHQKPPRKRSAASSNRKNATPNSHKAKKQRTVNTPKTSSADMAAGESWSSRTRSAKKTPRT